MPLEIRKLGYSERESEGIVRGNIFGGPLQAAVHVANWHISDQFISVNIDRLRVLRTLLAHGADVNGAQFDGGAALVGRAVPPAQ